MLYIHAKRYALECEIDLPFATHTCPFPSIPNDPSHPFVVSDHSFLQQSPVPQNSHGPCLWEQLP